MARERLAAEREVERTYRRELVRTCVECLGSCLLGLFCMAYALHSNDQGYGQIAFWGGMVIGYTGIFLSLIGAYQRGEERGDW
jgi:hypothetical protein